MQEGDSSVLSEEGKEEASFIETHPGFSNMADNDDLEQLVVCDGQDDYHQQVVANEDSPNEDDGEECEDDDEIEDEALDEEANAAALLELETERLQNIEQAKSLIKLIPKSFQRTRREISSIWKKWFFIPEIIDTSLEPELKRLDAQAYEMLLDSRKPNVHIFCCRLCYENPTTTLHNCFKKNSPSHHGPGNLPAHLATLHKEAYEEYGGKPQPDSSKKKKCLPSDKSDTATPSKRPRQESSQVSTSASASKSKKTVANTPPLAAIATEVSVASSITNSYPFYDLPNIQCHSSNYQVGTLQSVETFKVLCHDFITFNNIPVRVATSHHDCPEFKKLIMFAMTHGPQICKQENLIMGTKQFNNFRKNRFTTLLGAINNLVVDDRTWYKDYVKQEIPFITVGQDIWDSKQKEALGVTAFWYSPSKKKYYIIPLGLEQVEDKKAEASAQQTLRILALCGIRKDDIYRAVK